MLFRATHFYYSYAMINVERLRQRAAIVRTIRSFFDTRGYLSVETPSLARTPIPESHIRLLGTELKPYDRSDGTKLSLLPSPEYYLKRLLAEGTGSLYEIGPSFRNAEPPSGIHTAEFTMLEYYTVDADGDDSIPITTDLLASLGCGTEPLVLTMDEAWRHWAGIPLEPFVPLTPGDRIEAAKELQGRAVETGVIGGGSASDDRSPESWEDLFYRIFVNAVEPALPTDQPTILTRYPDAIPTLAQRIPGTPWADRWELYIAGMEIANCYGEETDPARLRSFFTGEATRIAERDGETPEIDRSFADLPLPRCSGVALGVDRLVATILGEGTIERVISFTDFR